MLIEIHMIQNHSPSNLNRDDLGAPKTCLFGGVTRARISSQCLKRSIRNPGNADTVHNREPGEFAEAMGEHVATRSKFFPDRVKAALEQIGEANGIPKDDFPKLVQSAAKITQKKDKKQTGSKDDDDDDDVLDDRSKTSQLVFFERLEAERMVRILGARKKEDKRQYDKFLNWKWGKEKGDGHAADTKGGSTGESKAKKEKADFLTRLRAAYGRGAVDIALFGRMTTSEAFEDVKAAVQVAHAISTHAVVNEVDYWTAVDDLGKSQASGHLGEAMFNSACFYKYFCLDWAQLVSNLAGPEPDEKKDAAAHKKWKDEIKPEAERLAACTLGYFIRAAALTTPSGKQNSFAANNEPCAILVEIKTGPKIPTSYANAFAEPARKIGDPPDDAPDCVSLIGRSIAQFGDHVYQLRNAYSIDSTLFWYALPLYRYPLQGWQREDDGRKAKVRIEKGEPTDKDKPPVQFATESFEALDREEGKPSEEGKPREERKPRGLVQAVVDKLDLELHLGFKWSDVKDAGKAPAKEPSP